MTLRRTIGASLGLPVFLICSTASAFPGFFAYKGSKPTNQSTHVVLMKKDATTVVTVMPDYQGDLKPFAVVLPVPDDVRASDVKTLRRDFVDRVDQLSAPRFHEFWEMDPCESGKATQEWERDLSVHGGGFLGQDLTGGAGDDPAAAAFKPGKEMNLSVDTDFKTGEQKYTVVPPSESADIAGWLKKKGYSSPDGTNRAAAPYAKAGMAFLVVEVDSKKIELVGGDRAIVSPIRYATKKPVNVDSTLGLLNLGDKQALFVYVLSPDHRYEVKNYANAFPPTNLEVDYKVKEHLGEFYAGLIDAMLAKNPLSFLDEYAWPTKTCGQPCPNEPLLVSELLSLGGDVFEAELPKTVREPKPPDMTAEQKKTFSDLKDKKQKKEIERVRKESARRKALIERQRYVLSRMHYRYDRTSLQKDVEVGPADPVRGGVGVPDGAKATLPTDVKPAPENQYQVRFVAFHPSPAVPHCDKPERYRWGIAPRTFMGLRKIYTAQDLATKNRTSFKPADMVYTPFPALALPGHPDLEGGMAEVKSFAPTAPSASASAVPPEGGSSSGKSCAVSPHDLSTGGSSGFFAFAFAFAFTALAASRRRSRSST